MKKLIFIIGMIVLLTPTGFCGGPTYGSKNATFTYLRPNGDTKTKLTKIDMGPRYSGAGARSTVYTHYNYYGFRYTHVSGSAVRNSYYY